jgi:FixJ family two-component response regulator
MPASDTVAAKVRTHAQAGGAHVTDPKKGSVVPRVTHADTAVAVVEDDPFVRRSLMRLLRTMNFQVAAFGCAEDFLDHPNRSRFASLVLDYHLPGMNGAELLNELDARDSLQVILISTDPAVVESLAGRAGMKVLAKPVDAGALEAAIAPHAARAPSPASGGSDARAVGAPRESRR